MDLIVPFIDDSFHRHHILILSSLYYFYVGHWSPILKVKKLDCDTDVGKISHIGYEGNKSMLYKNLKAPKLMS